MVQIRRVSRHVVLASTELLAEYEAECASPELGAYRINTALYAVLEDSGALTVFGAFEGESLVGFITVLNTGLPHFSEQSAVSESLFVKKTHRSTTAGARLIRTAEEWALGNGCVAICFGATVGSAAEAMYAKRYSRASSLFIKPLRNASKRSGSDRSI